jgi:hypothetical protein
MFVKNIFFDINAFFAFLVGFWSKLIYGIGAKYLDDHILGGVFPPPPPHKPLPACFSMSW